MSRSLKPVSLLIRECFPATHIPRSASQPRRDVPVHSGPAEAQALLVPPLRLVAVLRHVRHRPHAPTLYMR